MNKKIFLLCLAFTSCGLGLPQKKLNNSQVTLISYKCSVDSRTDRELSNYDSYINCNPPKGYDKVGEMMSESIYSMVKDRLESMLNVYMLPINSFMDNATYDALGFPEIGIQKAIKKGDTKYYLKIIANIESEFTELPNSNDSGIKPKIKVILEVYNKDGYVPIKVAEGISAASPVYPMNQGLLQV